MQASDPREGVRLDKWLWAARFFKTRSVAVEEIGKGRILVNGHAAKASREVREGDVLELRQPTGTRAVVVRAVGRLRGPASVAQTWYEETAESVARRLAAAERRLAQPEPALAIEGGRPTKHDRRKLAEWNRWSASADPE